MFLRNKFILCIWSPFIMSCFHFMHFLWVKIELAMPFPLSNFTESCHMNVVLYNQFEEIIPMINYIPWCLIFIPILYSKILEGRTTFGDPKVSPTLGGFNIDFLVFFSFLLYGQKKVEKSFRKCMKINHMHYNFLIPLNLFHT